MTDARWPRMPRTKRNILIGLAVVAVLIACLPWIIALTPLRNRIINAVVADSDLKASTGGVSIGWFSPLGVSQLAVRSRDVHNESPPVAIDVDEIECDMSWLQMLGALPEDAGTIRLTRPRVELVLPEEWPESDEEPGTVPTATIIVENASIKLRDATAGPVVDLTGLNLTLERTNSPTGGQLVVKPITVFERVELTPELCNSGLQLIAPVLSEAADVEGQISLAFDRLDVPLKWNETTRNEIHIEGNLKLHSVDVGLKGSPLSGAIELGAAILRIDLPKTMRISEEADIHFAVRDGRIHHEGLAVGLPEVSEDLMIRTSGSVGLDESLDLTVEIPAPRDLLARRDAEADTPPAPRKPIVLHIGGTLDRPKIEMTGEGHWATDLVGRLLKEDEAGEGPPVADTVIDIVGGLLERRAERVESGDPPPTPLLDRLRKRREERLRRREAESP